MLNCLLAVAILLAHTPSDTLWGWQEAQKEQIRRSIIHHRIGR